MKKYQIILNIGRRSSPQDIPWRKVDAESQGEAIESVMDAARKEWGKVLNKISAEPIGE